MKTLKTALILILTLGLFASCSSKKEQVLVAQPMDPQVQNLLSDLDSLEDNIHEGMVLRAATAQERKDVEYLLKRVRVLSMRLGQFPGDTRATMALYEALRKIEALDLTTIDQGMFTNTLTTLRMTIDHYSSIQGINVFGPRDTSIAFFKEDFKKGIGAFSATLESEGAAEWKHAFYEPKQTYYMEIKSFKTGTDGANQAGASRLSSPVIDLKDKKGVTIQVGQAYKFVKDLETMKIQIKEAVEGSEWTTLKFETVPTGNDWNVYDSEKLNVPEELAGKKVQISFLYNSTADDNPSWQIHSLELREQGE
ncbi:MAG: hypothetical protein EP326_03365 [Deltaproteobacteria bacterium]|nr:MAG: hypothetical protein EP326_03365 [Deltaproteobacteria bacterium]TNF27893.1 MAG: hypothetical protein EP319_10395 [Deltaproteobacteria bacterium]